MDKPGIRRLGSVRSRLPSNNSTPTSGTTRGTSTPTGSGSKNRSCSYSPITNPDFVKSSATERLEPKLLKPLGPTFPQSTAEKKTSQSQFKTKSPEDQATLLYMAYQQQHFLNDSLEEVKNRVQKDSKKQLEDLWALVKMKESEVCDIKEKTRLVKNHSELSNLILQLEPTLKQTTDTIKTVIPLAQELAQGLDKFRHQIRLDDINQFKNEEMDELVNVFQQSGKLSEQIQVNKFDQVVIAATAISALDNANSSQIKILEDCQQMASRVITRLGQEITLGEGETDYKKLSDLDI